MIGLGVGIDYSLFIVSRYRENRAAGQANAAALSAAMGSSGTAVFFAGGTVIAGDGRPRAHRGRLPRLHRSRRPRSSCCSRWRPPSPCCRRCCRCSATASTPAGSSAGAARAKPAEATAWWRLAHRISARPWPYLVAASLVPADPGRPGAVPEDRLPGRRRQPDQPRPSAGRTTCWPTASDPASTPPCSSSPTCAAPGSAADDIPALAQRIAADPGIAQVGAAAGQRERRHRRAATRSRPPSRPTPPPCRRSSGSGPSPPTGVYVTGPTALTLDLDKQLSRHPAAVHRRDPGSPRSCC